MRETEVEDQLPSIYKRLRSIQIANAALIYYLKIKGHSVSMIACAKRPAVQVVDSSGVFPCYMGPTQVSCRCSDGMCYKK